MKLTLYLFPGKQKIVMHKIHMHNSVLATNNILLINVFTSCQGNTKPLTFMQASVLGVPSPPSAIATALWLQQIYKKLLLWILKM